MKLWASRSSLLNFFSDRFESMALTRNAGPPGLAVARGVRPDGEGEPAGHIGPRRGDVHGDPGQVKRRVEHHDQRRLEGIHAPQAPSTASRMRFHTPATPAGISCYPCRGRPPSAIGSSRTELIEHAYKSFPTAIPTRLRLTAPTANQQTELS